MKSRIPVIAALAVLTLAACTSHKPVPPPPPPVANNNPVTVFFDYGKSNLTAAAADLVADALTRNGHLPGHETVTGYCDTAEHNCKSLALRRADAVRDEMVRRGMPAAAIDVRGSMDLLVSTGPHVREPQNRRAVIDPR